ncbi:outer membrane chaperone Skp [Tepiditoga spiralis]|uniref:Outer membrane chaperone Skp n=1 Tax=Tepiditoga spiralis TaxID=2108365 RepID=A0A7G1G5S6_9BACT|nr:OmpH family outer membrane protein [Tepiditoga spiralis]BBE30133.1 outer membrane chaperone Skp [Tepiditoga spiralis]
MKKIVLMSMVLLMGVVMSFSNELKIGFVNLEKVTKSYYKWTDLQDKYKNDMAYYQNKIEKMKEELQTMEKNGASKEDLQKKYQEVQVKVNGYNTAIQKEYTTKSNGLISELKTFIQKYAQDNNYDLILFESSVIFASEKVDITDTILKMVNEEVNTEKNTTENKK